ncbi:hypothetical protein [Pseudarthrobacter oxydans]|uniref:hypothetical protein n=1 Tax=Pseudarthrobacter oxydans TaxID=1671 RepID=UPI00381A26E9
MTSYPMIQDIVRPNNGRELAAILRRFKLDLPAEILAGPPATYGNDAAALIDAVRPQHDHLEDAAQAVIRGEDPTEHLILAAAWNFYPGLVQRIQESGLKIYIDTVNKHADEIISAIRVQVFEPTIDKLHDLDDDHPNALWNLETALAAGDYKQAAIIKDNAALARTLADTDKARRLLHPEAYDTDAAWSDQPGLFEVIGEPEPDTITELHWWMHTITNGHTPVYDTVTEWQKRDASTPFTDYREDREPADVPVMQLGFTSR